MTDNVTHPPILGDLATDKDALDFTPYVDALSEILLDTDTCTPLTLGVFGSWGSGKTSLMTMLKDRVGHTPRRRTVWVNAWKYHQEEALWRAFILRVLDALYPRESGDGPWEQRARLPLDKLAPKQQEQVQLLEPLQRSLYQTVEWEDLGRWKLNLRDGGKELAELPAYLLLLAAKNEKVAESLGIKPDLARLLQRESETHRLDQLASIEQFEATFRRALAAVLGTEGRLVVFVDDLDRCTPDKAIQVLEAIKLFLDVPGCIFVLGLDAEAIEAAVRTRYKEGVKAREYLEKIVQLPFILPPIEDDAMLHYVESLAPNLPDARCAQVFAKGLSSNPRQVKRTLNIYLLLTRLVQKREALRGTITDVRLAKIVAIQHGQPRFYELLRLRPGYLPELSRYYRTTQRDVDRLSGEAQDAVKLPEALQPFQADEGLRRLLCLFDEEDARFDGLTPLDVRSYITLTRRSTPLEAPAVVTARLAFEPEMVEIPAGAFWMGTSDEQIAALRQRYEWAKKLDFKREQPQHELTLPAYQIGRYPVTNAEYAEFVRATGHSAPGHWQEGAFPEDLADHPVVYVNGRDAQVYVQWLRERTGQPYRLPAEAEWEKAARGEDGRLWPWGNEWYPAKCNMELQGPSTTTPVGQYSSVSGDSPYGCADMAGNVWEWCSSLYEPYPYKADDGRESLEGSEDRVLRGGAYYVDDPGKVRCASRNDSRPDGAFDYDCGFRVARGSLPGAP